MLDLEQLRERCAAGESFEYVHFWGHQPSQDGTMTRSCFSQWFVAPFVVEGVTYSTAEHWMMAGKAKLFGDHDALSEIIAAPDPKAAKALGRKVRNFDDAVWKANCRDIVAEGNLHKFRQHAEMQQVLLDTGDAILVEAAPRDRIWGIGMGAANENAGNPLKWRGRNWPGFVLMQVRDTIRPG